MLRILHDTKYDFIKYWKQSVIGTIAFIALGLVLLGVHAVRYNGQPLNYSVEFLGGSQDLISIRGKGASLRPFDVVRKKAADGTDVVLLVARDKDALMAALPGFTLDAK